MPDDEKKPDEEEQTEPEQTEEEPPEVLDPRDARITELEAALSEATASAEVMAQALFTAQVGATGLLVNPEEMAYDPALLNDAEALQAAIVELLTTKPYLARMRVAGDVDQGAREEVAPFSLLGAMKGMT